MTSPVSRTTILHDISHGAQSVRAIALAAPPLLSRLRFVRDHRACDLGSEVAGCDKGRRSTTVVMIVLSSASGSSSSANADSETSCASDTDSDADADTDV